MSQFKEKHFNNNHHSSLQPGCKAKKCGVCFPLTPAPPTLYQHPFFPPKHEFRYEGDETLLSSTLTLTWDPHKQLVNIFRKDNLSWEGKVFSFQKLAGKKKKKKQWNNPKALPDSHNLGVLMAKSSHLLLDRYHYLPAGKQDFLYEESFMFAF